MNRTSVSGTPLAARRHDRRPARRSVRGAGLFLLGGLMVAGLSACEPVSDTTTAGDQGGSVPAVSAAASGAAAGAQDAARFCAVVADQRSQLSGTQVSGLLAGGTPEAWKAYLARTSQLNSDLLAASPPEIRPSVQTLKASDDQLAATLAAADYDPQKAGGAELVAIITAPQRRDATIKVTAYTRTHCGIDLATTPSA